MNKYYNKIVYKDYLLIIDYGPIVPIILVYHLTMILACIFFLHCSAIFSREFLRLWNFLESNFRRRNYSVHLHLRNRVQ